MRVHLAWLLLLLTPACLEVAHSGLHVVEPEVELPAFSTSCLFTEVDSLRPRLEWEPLERHPWEGDPCGADLPPLEVITYEVRIWKRDATGPEEVVESVLGLKTPHYQVVGPLEPDTEYLWSVRANFLVAQRPRVTEWALAGLPRRSETLPNDSCLKFRTPAR